MYEHCAETFTTHVFNMLFTNVTCFVENSVLSTSPLAFSPCHENHSSADDDSFFSDLIVLCELYRFGDP